MYGRHHAAGQDLLHLQYFPSHKRTKIVTIRHFLQAKIYLNAFADGALPRTLLGSLQRSPALDLRGHFASGGKGGAESKGWEGIKRKEKGEGSEMGRKRGKGRVGLYLTLQKFLQASMHASMKIRLGLCSQTTRHTFRAMASLSISIMCLIFRCWCI